MLTACKKKKISFVRFSGDHLVQSHTQAGSSYSRPSLAEDKTPPRMEYLLRASVLVLNLSHREHFLLKSSQNCFCCKLAGSAGSFLLTVHQRRACLHISYNPFYFSDEYSLYTVTLVQSSCSQDAG